jgi:sirohydrochlorin ferrochelatase
MLQDQGQFAERAVVAIENAAHEPAQWRCHWKLEKRRTDDMSEAPYETLEGDGNLLMTAGVTAIWNALTQGSAGAFTNATAAIGVGDSSTAAANSQTDLQAASNKLRKGMVATYPQVATNQVTFQASFGSTEANFAWAEWGVFSATSGGTMLNRKVEALGTKTTGTWTLTVTVSIS